MMDDKKKFEVKFRVWHVPQIPCRAFTVEVPDYAEAKRLQIALSDYDAFQLKHRIKPDYANVSGIQIYQHDLTEPDLVDMGIDDRWVDIADEDELNEYFDHLRNTGWDV